MQRKRDGLVPIGEAISGLGGPVQELRDASPQALHYFTRFDQVDQLVEAREADPEVGFMAPLMALCSLPRTNPGNRKEYVRRNGPYALVMSAGERAQARRAGTVAKQDPSRGGVLSRSNPASRTARHDHPEGSQALRPGPRSLSLV